MPRNLPVHALIMPNHALIMPNHALIMPNHALIMINGVKLNNTQRTLITFEWNF